MACICVIELKRFLSGDFWLHHSVMTYSFVTQPASSTSYADYTRRLTYRRSKVTVGRAAGLQRFRNASSFSRPAFPTQGTRGQKSGRQSVAENPFAHAEARMACKYHFMPVRRFSAALLFSAMTAPATARLGRLPTQGDGEATALPNVMGLNVPTVEESGRC